MDNKISLIITSKNDADSFEYLMLQISKQSISKSLYELHFLESGDKSPEILSHKLKVLKINFYIYYYPSLNRIEALNYLIKQCNYNIIVRLDSKTRIKENYLYEIIQRHKVGSYANVGGAIIPIGLNIHQRRIARLMKSKITFGGAVFRDKNYSGYVKSVYLGAFNKKIINFKDWFDFKNPLISEDSDLNFILYNNNKKSIFMDGKIKSYYLARENIPQFFTLCFNYGRARAVFVKKHRQFTGLRQIIPLLFYSTLILLSFGIYLFPKVCLLALLTIIVLYLSLIIREILYFGCRSFEGIMFYIYGILGCHFLWSIGFVRGLMIKIN